MIWCLHVVYIMRSSLRLNIVCARIAKILVLVNDELISSILNKQQRLIYTSSVFFFCFLYDVLKHVIVSFYMMF